MTNKTFILDTNVLLNNPMAFQTFEEHDVIIPLVVLEELDKQKNSDRDIARDAREVIRNLNTIIQDYDVRSVGVDLFGGGKLFVCPSLTQEQANCFGGITQTNNDDMIINIVLASQSNSDADVVLVSNDINMRLKAKGVGVKHTQEYRNDIIIEDPSLLPKGFIKIPDGWVDSLPEDGVIAKSCGETLIQKCHVNDLLGEDDQFGINDWLINESDKVAARFDYVDENDMLSFTFHNTDALMSRKAAGIRPRDLYQAIALDALLDPDIDIVVMDGKAGCGKTLLAMAAATEMVAGNKKSYRMDEIIFTRSNDTQFKEIGYLKGGEAEKMGPWLMGCSDNMEVIARSSGNKKFHPAESIDKNGDNEDAFIKMKSLNFMRGRSLNHRVLIVDEFQNLNSHQAKTTITRAGEYCKVIVMGNLAQIDNPTLSARSSGLTYSTQKLHGMPFTKVVCLQSGQRSRLAEFVEEQF